jgi:tRNA(fMet)-specific endonuclease VapC
VSFLLDTDTCIYLLDARHPARQATVRKRMRNHAPSEIAISVVTEAELRAGAAKSARPRDNLAVVETLLAVIEVLPLTSDDTPAFARIRVELERAGTPIGPYDLLIAAQALHHQRTLVTNNEHEFSRVPGLRLQNWSKA